MNEPKKIESLTPEQEAQMPAYRDKWIAIGLATGPADFEAAKKIMPEVYKVAGLEPPTKFMHMKSPLAAAEWEKQNGGSGFEGTIYGNTSAGWLAFYDFMHNVVGIDCSPLLPLMDLAKVAGWCWVYEDLAIITDRPDRIERDDQDRLHCEEGPALAYSDNYRIYAIHGVRVPEKVIEAPETLTLDEINNERNAEVMRVMIERFGEGKYMEGMGAKMVGDSFKGSQLYELDVPIDGGESVRMARVRAINSTPEPDGTSKIYWLKVPPGCSCTQEALAAIHPDPFRGHWSEYDPVVET